ncbi:unnamed protein product [Adineta steineri]|uniref:Polysaccharide pyruvyl transferase domain-containing protein n=1 Tax=Adineta steineri TaxID=433720 RepID=A0A819YYH9_9BILA|nr:unnamed protein product [Adineta steineri]
MSQYSSSILVISGITIVFLSIIYYYLQRKSCHTLNIVQCGLQQQLCEYNILGTERYVESKSSPNNEVNDHYFSIELPEPGVTELSCLSKNLLHHWHQLHPKTIFYLYIVGHDTLKIPKIFSNLRVHELDSSLIFQTPLKWWLNAHVQWKYRTAMKTLIAFDHMNLSYNPSDHTIPMFKHLKLIYSIVLLWHRGGIYISNDVALIKPIITLSSTSNVTLVQRSSNRISLDFLSIMASQHPLIEQLLIHLSHAYQNQDIMQIDAELILWKVLIKFLSATKNSIQLLPANTFYGFDKEEMFSNWFTSKNSSEQWAAWQNDQHRYGIHFPIVRVPRATPIPIKSSLIDRLTSLPKSLISLKQASCFHASTDRIHMGQLVYQYNHNHGNNGDYIQSWASIQYYPCIDRFYARDNLHNLPELCQMKFGQSTFRNDSLTSVSILMNAWWALVRPKLEQEKCWPPPDHFRPIYISMHIVDRVAPVMIKSRKTYDKYGPVGARDMVTLQLLEKQNISSWLSGCLTTTLKYRSVARLINDTKKSILIVDVQNNLTNILVPPDILRDNVIWSTALYTPENINQTDEQLNDFEQVEKRFDELLNSKLVLTSRLHVLLPCLALNIPVMFIYPSDAYNRDPRFKGLIEILVDHIYSEKDAYFWKNASHPYAIVWENPRSMNKAKKELLKTMISGLHQRLKQEREFRVWGHFYRVFD